MKINQTHEIYRIEDFNGDEKKFESTLYEAVKKGHVVCKHCHDHDHQLEAICTKSLRYQAMMPRDKKFEDDLRNKGTIANNNETLEPVKKQSVNTSKYSDGERLEAIGKYGLSLSCDEQLVDGVWVPTWRCQYGMAEDDVICGNTIRGVIDYCIDANQKPINE